MRTLMVLGIGLVVAGVLVQGARWIGPGAAAGALAFVALWFVFCGFDLAAGVRAGYGVVEELGIHLGIFIVPSVGAWLLARWLS